MRKILLQIIAIICLNITILAQENIYRQTTDNGGLNPAPKFALLDRTEITTGILINRSFLFSNHAAFCKDSINTNKFPIPVILSLSKDLTQYLINLIS